MDALATLAGTDDLHTVTAPRIIGTVCSHDGYAGLQAAFRARAESLELSRERLDEGSGLQSGYVGKLLARVPIKGIGRTSLGPLMGVLAVKILIVEDTDLLARLARIPKRAMVGGAIASSNAGGGMLASRKHKRRRFLPLKGNSTWGGLMRARQVLTQSTEHRKRVARKAAKVRWARGRGGD